MGSNPTSYIGYGFKSHQLQSICGTFCYFSGTFGCDTGVKLPDYIKPMTLFQTANSVLLPEGPAAGWAGPRPEDAKDAAMAALGREHGSFFGLARSSPNKASYWWTIWTGYMRFSGRWFFSHWLITGRSQNWPDLRSPIPKNLRYANDAY